MHETEGFSLGGTRGARCTGVFATTLSMNNCGRWTVETTGPTYVFDFGSGTVSCQDEAGRPVPVNGDRALRLVTIDTLRVGEPAEWWMRRRFDDVKAPHYRFVSEPVIRIESARTPVIEDQAFLGPAYSAEVMCERLRVEPATVDEMVAELELLQVATRLGRVMFPTFQVRENGRVIPGLGDVLGELADGADDPWAWWSWLAARPDHAGGRHMWELLADGETDTVLRAAGRSAWAWRHTV